MQLRQYQLEGVEFVLQKYDKGYRGVLVADEMGLGKTIQAIEVINRTNFRKILIVCPAIVRTNWLKELGTWLKRDLAVTVIHSSKKIKIADITIISYDLLKHIKQYAFDLVILDEAHYIKNSDAQRTKYAMEIVRNSSFFIALTGTPILAKPIELWNLLHLGRISIARDWKNYVIRYCGGYQYKVSNRWVWYKDGATNLKELNHILRSTFMIRRKKSDVLKELPDKIRQIIYIPAASEDQKSAIRFEQEAIASLANFDIANLNSMSIADLALLAKARHTVGLAKVNPTVEFVMELLESTDQVVVWAHHVDVVEDIVSRLRANGIKSASIIGNTDSVSRQKLIDAFGKKEIQVLVCSLHAASVGISFVTANTTVFAELDWTPSIIHQAEDRLHRIGQKNSVLVYYMVLENSVEGQVAETIARKQHIFEQTLEVSYEQQKTN